MRVSPLIFAALVAGAGCGGGPTAGIAEATGLVVYEGLPSPGSEASTFQAESKAKQTREIGGQTFYRDPLPLAPADLATLRGLLAAPGALVEWSGEKKCGGFHADDAIEWTDGGTTRMLLLCFTCSEAEGRGSGTRYDIAQSTAGPLKALMKRLRKQRPPWRGLGEMNEPSGPPG